MPIPVINYAALQTQGNPFWRDLLPSIQQGLQLGSMPMRINQDARQRGIANALAKVQLQYAPREAEADIQQKEAMAQFPFYGKSLPGSAGEVLGLEIIKKLYGEQSPQYQQALQSYQLDQQGAQSRIGYQNALTQSMPVRNLSSFGKGIHEQENIAAGLGVSGQPNTQLTPLKDAILNAYELKRQKEVTDSDTRKRNLFATNIEKTLSQIDPVALTQFGGAIGTSNRLGQKGLSAFGLESPKYDEFMRNMQDVEFLTSQIRQFYGDSIQPAMLERLNKLSSPATWSNNPKIAKALFNETKTVLEKEMQTYRDALKGTAVYQGNNQGLTITPRETQALAKAGVGSPEGYSEDDLKHTAEKYGISLEEVKKLVGIK